MNLTQPSVNSGQGLESEINLHFFFIVIDNFVTYFLKQSISMSLFKNLCFIFILILPLLSQIQYLKANFGKCLICMKFAKRLAIPELVHNFALAIPCVTI